MNTMMKKFIFIISLFTFLLACKSKQGTVNDLEEMQESEHTESRADALFEDMHNSQNSLDYLGEYYGLLPCADCMGIQFKLTLQADSSYTAASIYLGKSEEVYVKKGSYNWDEFGQKIICRIDNKIVARYQVEENRLVQFGQQGRIDGETEARYILHQKPHPLWNKIWFASSFKGEKITAANQKPNITFLPNGQVFGTGGCNQLSATYSTAAEEQIKVGPIRMTKKGCGELIHYDDALSEALQQSTSFKIKDHNQLVLFDRAKVKLAEFTATTID